MSRSLFRRSTKVAPQGGASTWHDPTAEGGFERQREKSRVLDQAYEEYCRLREAGQTVHASEFCERFPTYRKSLRRLIDVHDNLEQVADLDSDEWPVCGEGFLGYDMLHELGIGAIARVYLAAERALGGRYVAVKVSLFGDEEADTLGKLSHPNVVPVHSVQVDAASGMTAVCMPYLGSATLADLLDLAFTSRQLPERADVIVRVAHDQERFLAFVDRAYVGLETDAVLNTGSYVDGIVHLTAQLAEALAYTHGQGILHRDLKPSNVLLTPSARPMLLDFNLSCNIDLDAGRVGGTLPYMPPEQIREVHAPSEQRSASGGDPRADIFSLGVLVYELLTGRLPFGDPPSGVPPQEAARIYLAAQQRPLVPVSQWNPHVDGPLAATIHSCLDLDPAGRPASAAELAHALRRRFSVRQRVQRWSLRHRWTLLLASLFVVTAALATTAYVRSLPPYAVSEYRSGVDLLRQEEYAQAVESLNRSLKAEPDQVRALFARGLAYQQLGDLPRSIADLQAAAKRAESGIIYESLGYSLLSAGQNQAAAAMYAKAIQQDPNSASLRVKQAFAFMHAGKHGPAEGLLDQAIKLDPGLQAAYHLRSRVRLGLLKRKARSYRSGRCRHRGGSCLRASLSSA